MPASRSLIALLVGTIVLFGLVFVELKPGSSSSGGGSSSSHGVGAYQPDINKAKQAVGISNASNAASGNVNANGSSATQTTSSSSTPPASASTPAASSSASSSAATPKSVTTGSAARTAAQSATAADNLNTVKAAMSARKVVAMLFYNPGAADDQAVKRELASVPVHRGQVVKLAIPLSQAASFTAVTQQVPVNFSPTLVLIDSNGQASEILGYADTFEIDQRVADALAAG